jgi:hypothetical protein
MNPSDEAPNLSPWPFLIGDVLLLATAAYLASRAPEPLSGPTLIAVVICVALGAVLACVPFLLNYTRRQDLALAERQKEIAALARTTAESAEQISIVAQGLHAISDHTQRTLKHLDQLPQKLQEKINDFKTQLNEVNVTENEALAQEVNTLRTSEIERLETAFASVRKTTAELAALETATRQHLSDLNASLARFAASADRTTAQAEAALAATREEASQALAAAQKTATTAFEHAVATALRALETRLQAVPATPPVAPAPPVTTPSSAHSTASESAGDESTATAVTPPPLDAPPPSERPPEVSPVTSSPPFAPPAALAETAPEEPAVPVRKRLGRKSLLRDDQPSLGLELDEPPPDNEYAQHAPDENAVASAVSSDGLTRLLVTAYIGIGNKLYLRGDGPGLSWEKGAPLQFVSIGKWRWETADASEPITARLYKNDEQECTSLGTLTLDPGHQQEVRASF